MAKVSLKERFSKTIRDPWAWPWMIVLFLGTVLALVSGAAAHSIVCKC